MKLSQDLPYEKYKCREFVDGKKDTTCTVRYPVDKSRESSRSSSYQDCRDGDHRSGFSYRDCIHDGRTEDHRVGGIYRDCRDYEKRIGFDRGRSSYRDHRHYETMGHHRVGKTDSHYRRRSKSTEKSSDSYSYRKFGSAKSRHSRRGRISRKIRRSRCGTLSTSSSDELCSRSNKTFCANCNSTINHHRVEEAEKQRQKLNLVRSSHSCLEKSCLYVTKHCYSQCCTGNLTSCCGVHSCYNRKRKHENYSSESDVGVPKARRRSDEVHLKHGNWYPTQRFVRSHDICHGKLCKGPQSGTTRSKCMIFTPTGGCMNHALSSACAGHHGSPDICDIGQVEIHSEPKEGSSNNNREQNEFLSSFAIEKVNFVAGQIENQEYQDQLLRLSLKAPQRSELKVEGVSKNDLKLSLPDNIGNLNMEESIPSDLHNLGFHPSEETVNGNRFPVDSPHIEFTVMIPNMDPFSSCQPAEENINCLNLLQSSTSLPNLNLPDSGTTTIVTQGKSGSDLGHNLHDSTPGGEPQCTILNQSNWGSSGISEDAPVSEHAVLPNQGAKFSSSFVNFSSNEENIDACLKDHHFWDTSTSGAADCLIVNKCNMPQLHGSKEVTGPVIIIDDSEDECSEHKSFDGLHGEINLVGNGANVSIPDEISDDDGSQDLAQESKGSYVQDTMNPGNVLDSGKREFDLEYTSTNSANEGRNNENGIVLKEPCCSQSRKKLGEDVGSISHMWEDRTVEVISSEDESADDYGRNLSLLSKDKTLQESGEHNIGVCITSTEPDYMEQSLRHEDNNNCEAADSFDQGQLIRGVSSHKNRGSCSAKQYGNIEAVCNSKGISSTVDRKHIDRSFVETLLETINSKPRMWNTGILCDLCGRGPSLVYGEWYAWCCGSRLFYCKCTEDHKRKLKLVMKQKNKKPSKKWDGHEWSGKVHRMCALWSSEVFEKDEGRDQLEGLLNAVKRGRDLDCKDPECRKFGATLGCRVKNCRRSFHYPCAVKLASQLRCRMWEGFKRPVACGYHRHVPHDCASAKDWQLQIKWNYGHKPANSVKGNKNTSIYSENLPFQDKNPLDNSSVIVDLNLNTDDSETTKETAGNMFNGTVAQGFSVGFKDKVRSSAIRTTEKLLVQIDDDDVSDKVGVTPSRRGQDAHNVRFLGQNLICEDISHGKEAIRIPCTNDVDDASVPSFEYIIHSRFSVHAKAVLNTAKQAKPCKGCHEFDMDDPEASVSVHVDVSAGKRYQDRRIDWQGEPMLGRLPYDRYGLLQLGWLTIDVVECNSRCPCGSKCLNRELQKGLRVAVEVFKTEDRGWGVRALEQIPRGKFVVEYVGEVLTQGEVSKRGLVYDEYNFSYLFNVDHPAVPQEDHLVVDGFNMSNVARFINHSCDGNLSIYRIYTETLDHRVFRIGIYARRGIEPGEELTYDYKYIPTKEPGVSSDDPGAIKCLCGANTCRQVLFSAGI